MAFKIGVTTSPTEQNEDIEVPLTKVAVVSVTRVVVRHIPIPLMVLRQQSFHRTKQFIFGRGQHKGDAMIKRMIRKYVYPLGSIYMGITNPTDLYGGIWEQIETHTWKRIG